MICAVFWVKVHEKIKFSTTTFNFSLTVNFCITENTIKICSKIALPQTFVQQLSDVPDFQCLTSHLQNCWALKLSQHQQG